MFADNLDEGAVRSIAQLAQDALDPGVQSMVVGGHTFTSIPLTQVNPQEPMPAMLSVLSLNALLGYLRANRDELALDSLLVHVVSPNHVYVTGPLVKTTMQRPGYLAAKASQVEVSNSIMGQTDFVIMLNTAFALEDEVADGEQDHRLELIRLVSAVADQAEVGLSDDGRTQQIATKAGVVFKENSEIPNPCWLHPRWSFGEVPPPKVPFLMRARGNGTVSFSLAQVRGYDWQSLQVERIATHLRHGVPEGVTVIG